MHNQKTDNRTKLIEAAVKLVYQRGFDKTTIKDIAEEAGIPLGNVYYYFKTKEAICEAIVEQRLSDHRAVLEEMVKADDPKAGLIALIQMALGHCDSLARWGCPIGTLCAELHKEGGPLAEKATQLFAENLTWIEAQFRAMGRNDDAPELALHLMSALQGASLLAHSFHDADYVVREVNHLRKWIHNL